MEYIFQQQKKLIEKIPALENYFIPVYIPLWEKTIPFLPIRIFRDFDIHSFFTKETEQDFKIFLSSGSTGNNRSRHIFSKKALEIYEHNTCKGFRQFLNRQKLNQDSPILSLVPPSAVWPTSSLAAMVDMFSKNNFNLTWCDIDSKKEDFLENLKKFPDQTSCLIFGTTFHHLQLANDTDLHFKEKIQSEFKRLNISIIDTGGTKGRTQALTLEQAIEDLRKYYISPNFSFHSEYGMCELSSQAWSEKKMHDGSFITNETLHPFSVSIEKQRALPHKEDGFIAFIDTVNTESWGAIITEDVGYTTSENSFFLKGRGPDASVKGCSLNVRNFFTFETSSEKNLVLTGNSPQNQSIQLDKILLKLKNEYHWDSFSLHDFNEIATSIGGEIPLDGTYKNKNLFIISAANTPIAWLFPYLIACNSGAKSVTIKVPSLRLDDYYAESVIEKTGNLIEVFAQYFPMIKTYIDRKKSIAHNFQEYDVVITFGTDETLKTISEKINHAKTLFIGKGDIKNSMSVSIKNHSPKEIATLCSLWNGRGCLTPVVLFCRDDTTSELDHWIDIFAKNLEQEFQERFASNKINLMQEFAHSHNCSFVKAQIKNIGLSSKNTIYRGRLTCVVNLTKISLHQWNEFNLEINFGGCGFIYILPSHLQNEIKSLKELNILPDIKNEFNKSGIYKQQR